MQKPTRFGIGVFVFIFNRDFSKILLIKRNSEKRERYGFTWGTTGGKLDLGEYSIDGATREVREEIGVELKKTALKLLEIKELPNFTSDMHGFAFKYGAILDENVKITLNEESEGYQWFNLNSLPEGLTKDDDLTLIAQIAKENFGRD